MSATIPVEVCVACDDLRSAKASIAAAVAGGAVRVELCRDLSGGGLTPDLASVRAARESFGDRAGVLVMVRPRAGDFVYSAAEVASMVEVVGVVADAGADGVVFGALRHAEAASEGDVDFLIDVEAAGRLVETARRAGVTTTFHRAFDAVRSVEAVDVLISLGIDRVLTSGTPWGSGLGIEDGVGTIAALVERAAGRIEIVVGGGVTRVNVAAVLRGLPRSAGALSVHAYSDLLTGGVTDAEKVAEMVRTMG